MITKLRVLRNPDPVHKQQNMVNEYNKLLALRDKKSTELEKVNIRLRKYANLISGHIPKLEKCVK